MQPTLWDQLAQFERRSKLFFLLCYRKFKYSDTLHATVAVLGRIKPSAPTRSQNETRAFASLMLVLKTEHLRSLRGCTRFGTRSATTACLRPDQSYLSGGSHCQLTLTITHPSLQSFHTSFLPCNRWNIVCQRACRCCVQEPGRDVTNLDPACAALRAPLA